MGAVSKQWAALVSGAAVAELRPGCILRRMVTLLRRVLLLVASKVRSVGGGGDGDGDRASSVFGHAEHAAGNSGPRGGRRPAVCSKTLAVRSIGELLPVAVQLLVPRSPEKDVLDLLPSLSTILYTSQQCLALIPAEERHAMSSRCGRCAW